jgi:predicted RNA-binding protein with PIN domain
MPKPTAEQTKLIKKLVTEEVNNRTKRYVTGSDVTEAATHLVETAIRTQSRELESYLKQIDERLRNLEQRRS